jgi:hypothetical protein
MQIEDSPRKKLIDILRRHKQAGSIDAWSFACVTEDDVWLSRVIRLSKDRRELWPRRWFNWLLGPRPMRVRYIVAKIKLDGVNEECRPTRIDSYGSDDVCVAIAQAYEEAYGYQVPVRRCSDEWRVYDLLEG